MQGIIVHLESVEMHLNEAEKALELAEARGVETASTRCVDAAKRLESLQANVLGRVTMLLEAFETVFEIEKRVYGRWEWNITVDGPFYVVWRPASYQVLRRDSLQDLTKKLTRAEFVEWMHKKRFLMAYCQNAPTIVEDFFKKVAADGQLTEDIRLLKKFIARISATASSAPVEQIPY